MYIIPLHAFNTVTNRRRLVALGLSLCVFAAMSALLFIKKNLDDIVKEEVVIREISLSPPPPPPPPPQQQQEQVEAEIQLNVSGDGVAVIVSDVQMQDPLEALQLSAPNVKTLTTDWDLDLQVDWSAYGLNELDGVPVLLSTLRADWPRTLTNRGINRVTVRLDVFIDETGRINLISILDNPEPDLNDSIERVVKTARFSTPQKSGEAVRARFIWPVEFTKP